MNTMKKNLEDRINAFKNSVYKNASLRQDYNKFMGGRLVFKNICEMKYKQNEYKNGVFEYINIYTINFLLLQYYYYIQ